MKIKISALPEDCSPGDDTIIKRVDKMIDKAEHPWGWCTVKVSVSFKEVRNGKSIKFKGSAYLGCGSYLNSVDFVKNSGYFESLVSDAVYNARVRTEGSRSQPDPVILVDTDKRIEIAEFCDNNSRLTVRPSEEDWVETLRVKTNFDIRCILSPLPTKLGLHEATVVYKDSPSSVKVGVLKFFVVAAVD